MIAMKSCYIILSFSLALIALNSNGENYKPIGQSNIYYNNTSDMIVRPKTMNDASKGYYSMLKGTSESPNVTKANFAKGYLEITVPEKMDYPRLYPEEPRWVNFSSDSNTVDFHICLGSKPYRINDSANTLSATRERAYLRDCTGAYVGISAPKGCTVKVFLSCSSIGSDKYLADKSGISWNPNFYNTTSPIVFEFDEVCDGTYKEMTSKEPTNCLAGMKYVSSDWPDGYCVKFIDVVVYGVKPGDKVGFGGIQTLHPGWTPKEFVKNSEVAEIESELTHPVVIYNLQGIKVHESELAPGIYIRKQGNKVTKFIIK